MVRSIEHTGNLYKAKCSHMHFRPEDFDKSSLVYVKLKADAIPYVRHVYNIFYICLMRLNYFIF